MELQFCIQRGWQFLWSRERPQEEARLAFESRQKTARRARLQSGDAVKFIVLDKAGNWLFYILFFSIVPFVKWMAAEEKAQSSIPPSHLI